MFLIVEKKREIIDVRAQLQQHPFERLMKKIGRKWSASDAIDWELYDKYVDRVERVIYENEDEDAPEDAPDLVSYEMFFKNGASIMSKSFALGEDHEAEQLFEALKEMQYILKCCLRFMRHELVYHLNDHERKELEEVLKQKYGKRIPLT